MQGQEPLPASPATVGLYLTDRASTHRVASLRLRLVAIRQVHKLAGHRLDSTAPEIAEVLRGIIRSHGSASRKKAAAVTEIVRDAVRELAKTGDGLRSRRDQALLLVGFAAALRRSELVALDVAGLAFTRDGLVLTLRRRKTDQEGQGTEIGVPIGAAELTCPVRALRAWLDAPLGARPARPPRRGGGRGAALPGAGARHRARPGGPHPPDVRRAGRRRAEDPHAARGGAAGMTRGLRAVPRPRPGMPP
jgi:hypothetical protein